MSPRTSLPVAVLLLLVSMPAKAGVLGVPDGYTPDKRWPVIVSLQDNPDPSLTSKVGYFLVHSGDIGVKCTEKLEEDLKSLVARYNIDLNRIYGTGFSRGGHELLEQSWNVPHLFAAGAAVCNDLRYEPKQFNVKFIQTPMLLLHGDHDMFVKTGQRLHELMKDAGCPVQWGTYPGGHTPGVPFKQDVTLLTKFFEQHTFDPNPRQVTHVVIHPRYARAFWVDCKLAANFLDKPATQPELPPLSVGAVKGTMVKPYVVRQAVYTVKVTQGNRIEVQADEHVIALRLFLCDKLVAMDQPVTVASGGNVLYKGDPRSPLEIKLRDGPALAGKLAPPLLEQLAEIQKKAKYVPQPATQPATRAGEIPE